MRERIPPLPIEEGVSYAYYSMKSKKKLVLGTFVFVCLLLAVSIGISQFTNNNTDEPIVILDTDAGTDDAEAFLLLKHFGIDTAYVVATGGNASADNAVKNSVILTKYLNMDTTVVRGYEVQLSTEKNTFHGEDGLANISDEMAQKLSLSNEELKAAMPLSDFKSEIKQYDNIIYISVGPLSTLAELISDDDIKSHISAVYLMGGGISEFNCSHETEFNFSKNPEAVSRVLSSGLDITLFTLDVTNHQRVTDEQIDMLEKSSLYQEYITFLRYNMTANQEYNQIDAAVLHDTLPVLYIKYPEKFRNETTNIVSDEYGHIEKSTEGNKIALITAVEEGLLMDSLQKALTDS